MERDVRYFWVGAFVLGALVLLAVMLVWVMGLGESGGQKRFTVYFDDAVTGLSAGGKVTYKGVPVGAIERIRSAENRSDLIKVDIAVDKDTPANAGTQAELKLAGITGVTYIDMNTPQDGDYGRVPRINGEPYPVLEGSGSQIGQIAERIPEIAQNVLEMTDRLNALLDDENAANLSATVENVARISAAVETLLSEDNVANVTTTLENTAEASESFSQLAARLDSTADEIETVARSLSDAVRKNQENLDNFTRRGLDQVITLTEESQSMVAAIRKLADRLDEDPSQILYRPETKGVRIPE